MRLSVFGIDIRVDYTFFLVILLYIVLRNDNLLYVLLFSSAHELGHIVALYSFGGKAEEIRVSCYGIGLKEHNNFDFIREIIFLLSGLAVNLIFVLIGIQREINLAIMFVNALPIYPLDGGRITKLLLDKVFNYNVSYRMFFWINTVFLIFVFALALYLKSVSMLIIFAYASLYVVKNSLD